MAKKKNVPDSFTFHNSQVSVLKVKAEGAWAGGDTGQWQKLTADQKLLPPVWTQPGH